MPMRIQIQVRIVSDDDTVLSEDVIACFDKGDDQLEEIGLSLEQAKTVLAGAQVSLVEAQATSFLTRHRDCEQCGRHLQSKGRCRFLFRTAFGTIPLVSPRVHRCGCQPAASKTFSPLTALFTEHTAPELLYLETRWASLMSYGLTAGLLKEVLPVDTRINAATIRNHLHKVALRQEAELDDGQLRLAEVESDPADGKEVPVPEGPIVVGIDGAYLRSWHDKGKKFEVIVGKSVPEFRDHRYFGLVQTHDDKPEHRLFEVLHGQDLRINQGLTFLTDGGDSVRSFLDEISPGAETYLDWFHITMRLTVLSQYTKGLAHYNPVEALALHSRLERIKWRLWHGDTDVALSRAGELAADVAILTSDYPSLQRFAKAAASLITYIDNNAAAIPDYGERRRHAEPISTAFTESTVNLVVSKRFAKKQQMQWSRAGAHLLLQTRTQTLDGTLPENGTRPWPQMTLPHQPPQPEHPTEFYALVRNRVRSSRNYARRPAGIA
ncbi:hypothetical protein GGE65_008204 [Skermanella aerolata]